MDSSNDTWSKWKERFYPEIPDALLNRIQELEANKAEREAAGKRFKKSGELNRLYSELAALNKQRGRTRFTGGGLAFVTFLLTGAGVRSCTNQAEHEKLIEEIYQWPREYPVDLKPFERDNSPEAQRLESEVLGVLVQTITETVYEGEQAKKFKRREDAAALARQLYGNCAEAVGDHIEANAELAFLAVSQGLKLDNVGQYLLDRGIFFHPRETYVAEREPTYQVLVEFRRVSETGGLEASGEVAGQTVSTEQTVYVLEEEIFDEDWRRQYGGHYGGAIYIGRGQIAEKPILGDFGVSAEDEEKAVLANEVSHALFDARFPYTNQTTWEFEDSGRKLNRNEVSEMHSMMYEMESIPIVMLCGAMYSIQDTAQSSESYRLTWEIFQRIFKETGFFDFIATNKEQRLVMLDKKLWMDLGERVRAGEVAAIEMVKSLRDEFSKHSGKILKTGKEIAR